MYFVTHHKCASGWLSTYLARVGELNGLTYEATAYGDRLPPSADITMIANGCYGFLRERVTSGIHVIRNPFDLLVSAYYSHVLTHPLDGWHGLQRQRELLQSVPRALGFLLTIPFIERADFYPGTPGPFLALRTWDYDDEAFATIRMEDMVDDVAEAIGRKLVLHFGEDLMLPEPEAFEFERFADQRRPGEIDNTSHYRAGITGQWRQELPSAAADYVRAHHDPLLRRFYPEHLHPLG